MSYYRRRSKKYCNKKIYIAIIIIISFIIVSLIIQNNIVNLQNESMKGIKIKNQGIKSSVIISENNDVLLNPGKGLVRYKSINDNIYDDLISVGYRRYFWSEIEPEEGKYNWDLIDEAIESYAKVGKKFAFGIYNASSTTDTQYVTPKWVFDNGAEGNLYQLENGSTQMIPNWLDSKFLEQLNKFIEDLGKRYDGNPNIAYIDIRSYGNWGEQHVIKIGGEEISSEELEDLYINTYKENFKKTLLVNPWGGIRHQKLYEKCIDEGISIRRDGIFKTSNGWECNLAYNKLPTIFEYVNTYYWLKDNGYWNPDDLIEYIHKGKPSYIEFDDAMYLENKELYKQLANMIGYYFKFKEASFTNTINIGEENNIKLSFINEGVAPLYEDCTVYIGLLDENYNLVKKYKTNIDPHTWMPNEKKIENINIKFDDIEAGSYMISLGLFLNENDEKPTYLLGNAGKTNDNWYVFGNLQINEPEEEYTINLSSNDYYINNKKEYTTQIDIKNVHKDSDYHIERYINNEIIDNIKVENNNINYQNVFNFELKEGNSNIKIIIKKDNQIVYKLEKNIYVYSLEDNLKNISNIALQKYLDFEDKFAIEISKINGLPNMIQQQKQYITNIYDIATEDENTAKGKMKELFEIGNKIIQEYNNGTLNIEKEKLSSMLDMLNDIANSYEDLVTVSAKTREVNLFETKEMIDGVEKNINDNSDIDMVYPQKILKFSKDLYEEADYIYNLEEENDIKTGLIVSKELHAKYLAQWAKDFSEIYIDEYIEANPITETYSTNQYTNQDVTVTLNIGTDTKITNNSNSNKYTFKENGNFTFEYERRGRKFTKTVEVTNIDKIVPKIANIINEKAYNSAVVPIVEDENIGSIKLTLNGQVVENYKSGDKIEQEGEYNIIAIDKAGNKAEVHFYIIIDNYQFVDDKIINIKQQTTLVVFDKNLEKDDIDSYQILRGEKLLGKDDIICTGDILQDSDGKEYILIVAGDIDKDGKVTVNDYSILRLCILRLKELDEIEKLSADADVDFADISVADYSRMREIILGNM